METMRIDIVDPKAKRIIKELAELNLITIRDKNPLKSFENLLDRFRRNKKKISLEEIRKEVELVRTKRYGKKG